MKPDRAKLKIKVLLNKKCSWSLGGGRMIFFLKNDFKGIVAPNTFKVGLEEDGLRLLLVKRRLLCFFSTRTGTGRDFLSLFNFFFKLSNQHDFIDVLRQFFIDLAGSEGASQAMSAGTQLKEGCHINWSLLTLGNAIS
ncbi:uncharacterized protein [Spinacia oleracea]|uniref:Kinesin motor domain-containing protein n=1 Tax=Spinacia oleracea TaxID=3562 RepID=A0ABM3QJ52_SPIOL|nr:uncharacterized protein LOC110805326 [Spinacia oleracea]